MCFNNNLESEKAQINVQPFGKIDYSKDRFGNPCSAIVLDGKSYLTLNANLNIQKDFTCGAWVMPTGNSPWITIACKGNSSLETNNQPEFRLQFYNNGTNAVISATTAATKKIDPSVIQWQSNKWVHCAVSRNAKAYQFYLDGKMVYAIDSEAMIQKNSSPIFIGRDIPGGDEYFSGRIDDFFLVNECLSASSIKKTMQKSSATALSMICPQRQKFYLPPGKCDIIPNLVLPKVFPSCSSSEIVKIQDGHNSPFYKPGEYQISYQLSGTNCKCSSSFEVIDTIRPSMISNRIVKINSLNEIKIHQVTYKDNCELKKVKLVDRHIFKNQQNQTGYQIYRAIDIYGNISMDTVLFQTPSNTIVRDQTKPLKIEETIKMQSPYQYIHIRVYDNAHVDNDTISLFLNDQSILDNHMLTSRKSSKVIRGLKLNVGSNSIVFQAINTGTTGGNTCTIEVYGSNHPLRYGKKDLITRKVVNVKKGVDTGFLISD